MLRKQSCGTCHYYERENSQSGRCRRVPPTVIGVPIQGQPIKSVIKGVGTAIPMTLKQFSVYPPVRPSDVGCGRYLQERETDKEGGLGDE